MSASSVYSHIRRIIHCDQIGYTLGIQDSTQCPLLILIYVCTRKYDKEETVATLSLFQKTASQL